eukprot:jgi/Mesen1/2329/ME000155S01433
MSAIIELLRYMLATALPPSDHPDILVPASFTWQVHKEEIDKHHLRELLSEQPRCESMIKEYDGIVLDYSRQRVTQETVAKLLKLAETAGLKEKIGKMFSGEHINSTENRAVLHVALRAPRDKVIESDGKNVVPEVWEVLDKIKAFSEKLRSGEWVGATGKPLTDVPGTAEAAKGRRLRFLSNVDPIDVASAVNGLDQETTLVVVVSKTFTTAETMLNARTVRTWITSALGPDAVSKHMVAVSTNLKLVKEFGIDPNNAFGFWDWVGGRYSVTSAVGVLPLALQYGFDNAEKFLQGAWSIDEHYHTTPFESNLPVLLGLLSVWNVSFLGCPARAILPYCQALAKLAPHIQQLSMESNGKGGRVIPCDFIGIIKSQQSVYLAGEIVSNHDELMCNFFAQADALAYGKTREELRSEGVPDYLIPHKTFTGDRPSLSVLLPALTPYTVGQVLASKVRTQMNASRAKGKPGKTQLLYPEPHDVFPPNIISPDTKSKY